MLALATLAILTTGVIYLSTKSVNNEKKYYKEYIEFRQKFNKLATSPEELDYRYSVFSSNMDLINLTNAKKLKYKLGINQFSDLTWEEFKSKYLSPTTIQNTPSLKSVKTKSGGKIDWRKTKNVSRVKNQDQCGSCWAFSTTGSLESAFSIFKNKPLDLSEQELVDCASSYGNNGCNGGLMNLAYDYIRDNSLTTETNYPYEGYDNECRSSGTENRVTVSSYEFISPADVNGLMKALDQQPVSVAIEVQQDFMQYKEGVYENEDCGDALNHGVLAVGYDNESVDGYFIVKNSWDVYWGDEGYVKMAIGNNGGSGTCGIANESDVYPVL